MEKEFLMKHAAVIVAVMLSTGLLSAQEGKKVPKDSVRVSIPGCTRGYVFTSGPPVSEQNGTIVIPEGIHIRMAGPKKMMDDIKAHEGSMVEITGLMKKGQYLQEGVAVGGGVRITPGIGQGGGSVAASRAGTQTMIDVESWRPAAGSCPSR
jgi:hypothetical protein